MEQNDKNNTNNFNLKDELVDSVKKALKNVTVNTGESVKNIVEKIEKEISDTINNVQVDELFRALKIAWKLEELHMDTLSLEKCIALVKKEFNPKLYSSACILDNSSTNKSNKYKFEIQICFLDKNNEPLLNGDAKHWVIYTNSLDRDLLSQFGDKNMIVLK
ncbi:hypothetical protein [Brachyspira innocens]|nr:hypothetical protein [Brachyspira innocens]